MNLQYWFVKNIYADHNKSRNVKNAINKVLAILKPSDIGLNIGAGFIKIHPAVLNVDIFEGNHIDIVAFADKIPLPDNSVKVIFSQETLEHVSNPESAVKEMFRLLDNDGLLYCQLPFIIGYHPGPTDFWRFTKEGIVELFEKQGFKISEIGVTVGTAVGFYRILVEFFAVFFSLPIQGTYKILKAFFAILFFPIKYLDIFLKYSKEYDRIAGGYYIIAHK